MSLPSGPTAATASWSIGRFPMHGRALVAPMAGVTDRPYRQLCRRLGACYAVSEMAASNPALWNSVKTSRRIDHAGEASPKAVQIAGGDPAMMAQAARFNVDRGADIIDINFGCPVKKVCNARAGSALMADEALALRIVEAVVQAVAHDGVPVTVKMRTGPSPARRNALSLARSFEAAGIAMLVVHGRTRDCAFNGEAEYDTIAQVCEALRIPVVANGDICTPQQAQAVLARTGAAAVMIGRAAQGRPWLFGQVDRYLKDGTQGPAPDRDTWRSLLLDHLQAHHTFHGPLTGARTARKHVGWYLEALPEVAGPGVPDPDALKGLRDSINGCDDPDEQLRLVDRFFQNEGTTAWSGPGAQVRQAVGALMS